MIEVTLESCNCCIVIGHGDTEEAMIKMEPHEAALVMQAIRERDEQLAKAAAALEEACEQMEAQAKTVAAHGARDEYGSPMVLQNVVSGLRRCAKRSRNTLAALDASRAGGEEPQRGEKGHVCDNPDCSQCWGPSARSRD